MKVCTLDELYRECQHIFAHILPKKTSFLGKSHNKYFAVFKSGLITWGDDPTYNKLKHSSKIIDVLDVEEESRTEKGNGRRV